MLNTEVDSPVYAVNGMLRSTTSFVTYAGRNARCTSAVFVNAVFRCAFDAVDVPSLVGISEVERVAANRFLLIASHSQIVALSLVPEVASAAMQF